MNRVWDGRSSDISAASGMRFAAKPRARGFTLMELLVVIGIIAILMALSLAVGAKVTAAGKVRLTENALKILDSAAAAFDSSEDGLPAAVAEWADPADATQKALFPVADGRVGQTTEMLNSVGWFIYQCQNVPAVAPTFQQIDPKLMKKYAAAPLGAWDSTQPELATVMDGWGNPIRYVHPATDGLIHGPDYEGASLTLAGAGTAVDTNEVLGAATYAFPQIRRNNVVQSEAETPDSDGGLCTGGKPYFYSAGPDGKVGYLVDASGKVVEDYNADNVYLITPTFQQIP